MRIHQTVWLFLVGVMYPFVRGADRNCVSSEKCMCYNSFEYEFQCPPNNFDVVLHTIPDKYVKIDCYNFTKYDLSIFPDIDAGNIKYFEMKFCPFPNDSFSPTLNKFNINKIDEMQFLEMYEDPPITLVTKEFFKGLGELKQLTLNLFGSTLDEDFLENLPNLLQLYLDKSNIEEIGNNMFHYTPKLRVLHLSRNSISSIPDELFKSLPELQQLHLWKNELTSLNQKSFVGLNQLKSLELSSNKIAHLDDDTFAQLVDLVNISLRSNNLSSINSNIFKNNKALEGIRIGNNPNLYLSNYVFANLTNLTNINMDNCNLEFLPNEIFKGSINLLDISIKNNKLKELWENIFEGLSKLSKLDLSGNEILHLPSKIFFSLEKLRSLNLENNKLTEIDDTLFKNVPGLKTANLKDNEISVIGLKAFYNLKQLVNLDLSQNKYELKYGDTLLDLNPFNSCEQLERLNLSYNLIDEFPGGVIENKVMLKYLDLRNNKIQSVRVASLIKVSRFEVIVDLNNNNISEVDFSEIKAYAKFNPISYDAMHSNDSSTVVYISNNPINCDCSNFDLVQYSSDTLDPVIKTQIDIRLNNVQCSSPRAFSHILVKDLKPNQITCPLQDIGCPKECICDFRPYDSSAVVNCAFRNLTEIPEMNITNKFVQQAEVSLEGNMIEVGPYSGIGYENVTKLYLSNNLINNLSWVPPKIKVLKLNGNKLKYIESKVLHFLNESNHFYNLTLYDNPWSCGCSAVTLQNFIRFQYKKVNPNDVICEDNNQPLINIKELCKSRLMIALAIAVPVFVVLFFAALSTALYFYYQEEIKVWLYAKNLCLWFVTEEELDKDKTYDVFISYSHKDEEFVIQNLLPVLESGPNPFKLCIHVRDWVPGEFIPTQVTNSVLDSRRTLVVLSENFLESVWGKMEFRTAHTQAINEGRTRVIVVKYGKLDEDKLDDELKLYLKTNTYVEWGDPWFWNKLKYALPHSKKNKYYDNNQKHANIMLKIDDKFELVTSLPTVHTESTPPVISLDPSLLKNHPLNFDNLNNVETPPAEAPLIITR